MKVLFSILFQTLLVGIAAFLTAIYTAHFEFETRYSSPEFKPKLLRDREYQSFSKLPLETEFPIDGIELSLVIPAFNEEKRLPPMIESVINHFKDGINYEIIIVSDGSNDNTWGVIRDLINKKTPKVKLSGITYNKNSGKGYAVAAGMKYARGKYILMVDADGATPIENYDKLKNEMDTILTDETENGAVVIGSRHQITDEITAKRTAMRKMFGLVNNFVVRSLIGIKGIKDTQCGFKLFSRVAAKKIFFNLHLVRWAFDVEMLYIAQQLKMPISEIPVNFEDVPGSKLNIVTATISFFRDYFAMLTFYSTGFWNIK